MPGDPGIDENKPVILSSLAWNEVTQKFEIATLIPFYLNKGIATYNANELNPNVLFQNPTDGIVKFDKKNDVYVEASANGEDLSEQAIGKPNLETNLHEYYAGIGVKHNPPIAAGTYAPTEKFVDGKKELFDSRYPEYFKMTRKYIAEAVMGRWSGKNLENLIDSTEFTITVDDTTKPTVIAPADVTARNNADMSTKRMGSATATDNSPYPLDIWYQDNEVSNDGDYKVIERTFFAEDVRGNIGEAVQKITLDLNTGVEEMHKGNKALDIDVLGNPVTSKTRLRVSSNKFLKEGRVFIYNTTGQLIDAIEVDNLPANEEREIGYSGFGSLRPGSYMVVFKRSDSVASKLVVR